MIPIARRLLAWGVAFSLLLPLVLVLVLALGGIARRGRRSDGGRICLRTALGIGVVWVAAVVTTAVAGGLLTLEAGTARPAGRLPDDGPAQE